MILKHRGDHSFAWMEGHIAAAIRQPFTSCPYTDGSTETSEWLAGYAARVLIEKARSTNPVQTNDRKPPSTLLAADQQAAHRQAALRLPRS